MERKSLVTLREIHFNKAENIFVQQSGTYTDNLVNSKNGITLIAFVITIVVLLILAGVTIAMLVGQNGILTNATTANSANTYMQAEEQVKLAYMAVKTEIMTQKVADSNYDATIEENTTKIGKIVEDELTGEGWNVDYSIAGRIFITYNNSKIMADTIEKGKPCKNGEADFAVLLDKQEATLKTVGYLSKEFQQVEYIESTGAQWIDTKVIPNENTKVIIDFEFVEIMNDANIFTANWSINGFAMITVNGKLRWHYNNIRDINFLLKTQTKYLMKVYRNNVIINNNEVYNSNSASYTQNKSIKLFGYINNTHMNKYKLYNFSTYESNKLTSNFIPCKSTTIITNADGIKCPSGTIGLYDTVEGKFCTNQGSGTFIAGSEV